MQPVLRTILQQTGLYAPIKAQRHSWLVRTVTGRDRRLINDHFASQATRKLNLGSGYHVLDGWLSADIKPTRQDVLRLDATRKYPFGDQTFDYVYSQHMIEHISYQQGQQMLRECFRILKDDGKIRIATPDLLYLISLYQDDKSALQKAYMQWITRTFMEDVPICADTFVINHCVRAWGHTFIYDQKILRLALEAVGFREIVQCAINASEDPTLCNLEHEERAPPGFLKLESVILEATK